MKTTIFIFLTFIICGVGFAQEDDSNNDVDPKIAFLNNRLKLSPDQAKLFWPVYDEFDKEKKVLAKNLHDIETGIGTNSTDEDLKIALRNTDEIRQKKLDLEKNYANKFLKVITPRQTVLLFKAQFDLSLGIMQIIDKKEENGNEKIENAKIAFITKRLGLTSEQAKQFWPVYDNIDGERKAFRQSLLKFWDKYTNPAITDDQVKSCLKEMFEIRQKQVNLEKSKPDKLFRVINPRQTTSLYKAEVDFQRELMREIKERRMQFQEKRNPNDIRMHQEKKTEQQRELRHQRLQERKSPARN